MLHESERSQILETLDNKTLVLDLVEWLASRPRPYEEVMAAWRTSCPRLSIWEDAVDNGLVERFGKNANETWVRATDAGRKFLQAERSGSRPSADALTEARWSESGNPQ